MKPLRTIGTAFKYELVEDTRGCNEPYHLQSFVVGADVNICRFAADMLGRRCTSDDTVELCASVARIDDDGSIKILA